MIPWTAWLAIVIGVIIVLVFVVIVPLAISRRRNVRTGATEFVQRSRLLCPKCEREFDYEWIPGAALTAVRLGTKRYMACPLCHHWSTFDVWNSPAPPPAPSK
jgi:hypothetical protein